jgi:ABC-type multidrug transport system ATPase subunit
MTVVRKMANQNRTCISTIHQPSPEVFALFDLVVLVSAGRLAYFGPVDDVMAYFTSPDMGYKYPQVMRSEVVKCGVVWCGVVW